MDPALRVTNGDVPSPGRPPEHTQPQQGHNDDWDADLHRDSTHGRSVARRASVPQRATSDKRGAAANESQIRTLSGQHGGHEISRRRARSFRSTAGLVAADSLGAPERPGSHTLGSSGFLAPGTQSAMTAVSRSGYTCPWLQFASRAAMMRACASLGRRFSWVWLRVSARLVRKRRDEPVGRRPWRFAAPASCDGRCSAACERRAAAGVPPLARSAAGGLGVDSAAAGRAFRPAAAERFRRSVHAARRASGGVG